MIDMPIHRIVLLKRLLSRPSAPHEKNKPASASSNTNGRPDKHSPLPPESRENSYPTTARALKVELLFHEPLRSRIAHIRVVMKVAEVNDLIPIPRNTEPTWD